MLAFIDFPPPSPLPVGAAGYADGRGSGERIPPVTSHGTVPSGFRTCLTGPGANGRWETRVHAGPFQGLQSQIWAPIPALPL